MLAPKSWLTEFVDLTGISDERFAQEMTFAGNKVESIQTLRFGGQKINREVVYEFEITSNRPDTLSIIGIAREAAAVFDRKLKLPVLPKNKNLKQLPIKLAVENKTICPAFSIVELDNIRVKPSSSIICKRLEASGIRPINNVVDITNYVMLETGQPMHAFDADTLQGPLLMRAAKPNEQITTIDHKNRTLSAVEYIIEDKERLVHLAGLMGEVNSEISEKTTHILLHVPVYDPVFVRRSSKHLRLRTEGSTRFEKKLDLTQTENAALRAIELLEKEAGAKQTTAIVTTVNQRWTAPTITISEEKVSSLVGLSFTKEDIERYLSKIGISPVIARSPRPASPVGGRGNLMAFQPPSWRRDITIPVDLVEEVTRLYGYNKFQRTLPSGEIPINPDALTPNWKRIVAEACAALGYTEMYASTLIGKTLINELGFYTAEQHLKVLHPMSGDFEYMRRTTLETLVPFLKQNLLETSAINIFELGTVFTPSEKSSELPEQLLELGLISTTKSYAEFKGNIKYIGKILGTDFSFEPPQSAHTTVDQANKNQPPVSLVEIYVNNSPLERKDKNIKINSAGYISLISPYILGRIDITAYIACFNMTEIFKYATKSFTYPQLSGYPPIVEDLTLERPAGKYLGDAISTIKNISPLVQGVDYLGEYQQYVTLRVTYQSFDRSLTQEEVGEIRRNLLKKLESLGWKLKI